MAEKKSKKKTGKDSVEVRVITCAMSLAAVQGWQDTTMAEFNPSGHLEAAVRAHRNEVKL